jgi:hypothetical protein
VTVAYAYPQLVQATVQTLAEQFMQQRPDIRIALQGALPGYDELLQAPLRGKLTNDLPDIAFHGMHYVRQVAGDRQYAPTAPTTRPSRHAARACPPGRSSMQVCPS